MRLVVIGVLVIGVLVGCGGGRTVPETAVSQPTATTAPDPTAPLEPTVPVVETAVSPPTSQANADVVHVRAVATGDNSWTFHVTVAHPDTGWEDYADGWDVVLPDGTVLLPNDSDAPFTRLLLHPHETEQPFTRSQSNIIIPANITTVTVRAHDLIDGFGGQEVVVDLTQMSGTNFDVER